MQAALKLDTKHPHFLKINKQAVLYILYKYYFDIHYSDIFCGKKVNFWQESHCNECIILAAIY